MSGPTLREMLDNLEHHLGRAPTPPEQAMVARSFLAQRDWQEAMDKVKTMLAVNDTAVSSDSGLSAQR